jgi:hypothetical protein
MASTNGGIENGELRIEIHAGRRVLLHSPFSIINSWVTEEDFEKAAGAKKVMILDGVREKSVLTLRSGTWQATLSWRFRKID